MSVVIDGHYLSINDAVLISREYEKVVLSEKAKEQINNSRKTVETILEENKAIYGVNTGFGKLSNILIPKDKLEDVQRNLIVSHAVGAGKPLAKEIVRMMLLLRINSLSFGFSGIRLSVVETMVEMLNKDVVPLVPEKGSLGASGDLALLAHMVLPMIGEGKCYYKGNIYSGSEAMKMAGISTVTLQAKEGLALINGTQAMTACGVFAVYDAVTLLKALDITSALTTEALLGIVDAFDIRIQNVRPHLGQIKTANNLHLLLNGSKMITKQGEKRVQDGYSIRCIPQIHGACKDAIDYVWSKVEIEINSVTDNPIIFSESMEALSGGNFHGEVVAMPFDYLGIALAEIASISECRIERLVNPNLSLLPAFLTEHGGLNSGYMIVQYSAASLVSENKVLAHPASVDSISSSAGQEDHVSMGTIAARKALEIAFNAKRVIAMEMMCAVQALDLQVKNNFDNNIENIDSVKSLLGKGTKILYQLIREKVPFVTKDRVFYNDINTITDLIEKITKSVEEEVGPLEV